MQAPKIPSIFNALRSKEFSFKPRYYDKSKERIEAIKKGKRAKIKFNKEHNQKNEKVRNLRIIFLIIILSLLAYKFIIN